MGRCVAVVLLLAACGGGEGVAPDGEPPFASCGNAVVDDGEACDDGDVANGDGCSETCRFEACGNAVVDVREVCDDGNTVDGDGCSATCASDETCGNGVIDVAAGETCENAGTLGNDGCSDRCGQVCGQIHNPYFLNDQHWELSGADIDLDTIGIHGLPGVARIFASAQCPATASLRQSPCMRPHAELGTLELSFWARTSGAWYAPTTVVLDGVRQRVGNAGDGWEENTLCLGESGYGDVLDIEVAPVDPVLGCTPVEVEDVLIDEIQLRSPAPGRCADPGTVLHGDFEDPIGWTLTNTGVREIIDDGTGNMVLHLRGAAGVCQEPFATGRISPPLGTTLDHPALQFSLRGTATAVMTVSMDLPAPVIQRQDFTPAAGNVTTTHTMCIDPVNLGRSFDVRLSTNGSSVCAQSLARDVFIDDVQFVSDPSCP